MSLSSCAVLQSMLQSCQPQLVTAHAFGVTKWVGPRTLRRHSCDPPTTGSSAGGSTNACITPHLKLPTWASIEDEAFSQELPLAHYAAQLATYDFCCPTLATLRACQRQSHTEAPAGATNVLLVLRATIFFSRLQLRIEVD